MSISNNVVEPKELIQRLVIVAILICLPIGAILSIIVDKNTKTFRRFIENITPTDIVQIDVKRGDFQEKVDVNQITIIDREVITDFVLSLKSLQTYQTNHDYGAPEDLIRIRIWLSNGQTIEFECWPLKDEETTIVVGYIWIKPNIYSFGNGDAKFPDPAFHDWLMKIGFNF